MTIQYDRSKPYNNLPLLPPSDDKVISINVLQQVNHANRALAELKGFAKKLPNQSMLVNTISLREAKASTEIENIFTTDDELYKALSGNEVKLNPNAKEVLRYRQALWKGVHDIRENGHFNLSIIINIYQQIKEVNDSIRPPQTETTIRRRGSGLLGGSVIYTPPRGEDLIEKMLLNLMEFLNDDEKYPYDPLIKLAISHYQFEAIHPFRDGNGRTGRILNLLVILQKKLLDIPILYMSAYIIENKDEYYALLNKVTTLQIWEEWIIYILKSIEETAVYTINKINEIDKLFTSTLNLINQNLPNTRKETVEKIFEQPYISPKMLISKNLKSINTAKKYLEQMCNVGILTSKKVGKETIYLNIDLFNLLSET